jgi:hypothetical protein
MAGPPTAKSVSSAADMSDKREDPPDLDYPDEVTDEVTDGEQNSPGAYRDGMLGGGAIGGAIGAAANDAFTGAPVRDDERREEQEGTQ